MCAARTVYNPRMSYLVLARKWRPRSFDTLVGQEHVVRALTHALSTQRLHHAWLFTGTRGVGKTTLSRILAKSLNCETGITATPCGQCRACVEIDEGRFVDYLELDAASNRGVDEMTQLLEQAVYAPGSGRFKVYMIDEVHMLTGHAFNAMLKTLEEPPPHVKFILATTDPQKIPVTVLSRCLQFNLKQMPAESIVGHLQQVLGAENMGFELPALRLIAQAAAGSMRDALSLTDQAIAYSAGNLSEDAVRAMLGTIDQRHLARLLDALAVGDGRAVLVVADELAARGLSYLSALGDLAVLLSRIAIEQRVPGATSPDDPLAADITRLAASLHPDALQLFYSVAVHSRNELSLAPDEYAGFVMACLRMLALLDESGGAASPSAPAIEANPPAVSNVAAASSVAMANAPLSESTPPQIARPSSPPPPPPSELSDDALPGGEPPPEPPPYDDAPPFEPDPPDDGSARKRGAANDPPPVVLEGPWHQLAARLPIGGLAGELARQSEWLGVQGRTISLRVAARVLLDGPARARLRKALGEHFGGPVQLHIVAGETGDETAHAVDQAARKARQLAAETAIRSDPFVQSLVQDFGASVVPGSVQALQSPPAAP